MALRAEHLPEIDVARIQRFASDRIPAGLAGRVRLEVEVEGRTVTIVERRPPWREDVGAEWSRVAIAQFRCDAASVAWSLYWQRASGRWERYEAPSTWAIERLLAELDADPNGVFWG